jgi:Carbohydrate-selective porin, OprB family/S-layer homology domain
MNKTFWNVVKFGPVALAAALLTSNSAFAAEAGNVTSVAQLADSNNIGQVTSVSQFSDVQPTDWAFQALQSLVERYGCIAGYPNKTFRGNRAMTRYEFAAGLNACLDRVNELIATATADLVKKEDLEVVKRLQEEFGAELATLRGRVDGLEARVDEIESKQFSTTTKLSGEVIFNVAAPFGDKRADNDGVANNGNLSTNIAFSDRVRLNLNSSFTGKDRLNIRLQARNTTSNTGVTGTNMTRLSFDGAGTGSTVGENDVEVDKLNYAFNLSDNVRVQVDASNGEFYGNMNNFNPDLASDGRGSISRYGRFSPIYRLGAGGAGATVNINPNGPISASLGYLASNANNPASGLTNGSYAFIGQLGFKPINNLNVGLTYANAYQTGVDFLGSTGSNNLATAINFGSTTNPAGAVRASSHHYGLQANYKASSNVSIGGWVGFANATAENTVVTGPLAPDVIKGDNVDLFYWAANLAVKDFGGEGNLLGFTFGQQPRITGGRLGGVSLGGETNPAYHLEGLYRMQMNDNISITPGLIVIFNPEHNSTNPTQYIGTLRTTFTF